MNRHLWTRSLTETTCPAWPCPVCNRGIVALVQKSLLFKQTVASKREHGHEDWNPTCVDYTFTAWGQCTHSSCKQDFAIAGTGGVEPEFSGPDGDYDWEQYFLPNVCRPMPDMFNIPPKCPNSVIEELRAAFSLYWLSHEACAGRIRVALECLMKSSGCAEEEEGWIRKIP